MSDMTRPVLDARNLGKAYSLTVSGSQKRRGGDIWRAIFQRRPAERHESDEDLFWAVQDISITLQPGESLGVVGRNGAGKTTLMKMLSGILPPDKGSIDVNGEIQAMVNLSGGIDKNLSGRQNIANAAALRGLTSKQLAERVDQIIAFAELENAIDRLVSTYSSGMKARLGFAICVHMDPSLLIIDEALAVGDTRFKQKCLRRLNEMRANGVAMVLVSHSATQIRQFCERAIWIDGGAVRFDGTSAETLLAYQDFLDRADDEPEDPEEAEKEAKRAKAKDKAKSDLDSGRIPASLNDLGSDLRFTRNVSPFGPILLDKETLSNLRLNVRKDGKAVKEIKPNDPLSFAFDFELARKVDHLNVSLIFYDDAGARLSAISSLDGDILKAFHKGAVSGEVSVKAFPYPPGKYHVVIAVHDGSEHLYRHRMASFRIRPGDKGNWPVPIYLDYEYSGSAKTVAEVK